jgi:hypothetical protein
MNKLFISDERMQIISGRIAVIFLVLTQTALLASIIYRTTGLGESQEQYGDIRLILFISVFGYLAARLYYGAILPMISLKTLFGIYLGLVVFLFIVLVLWLGLPDLNNWQNTILPVLAGPAILVIGYGSISYFGKKRLEKEISGYEKTN